MHVNAALVGDIADSAVYSTRLVTKKQQRWSRSYRELAASPQRELSQRI